MEKKKVFLISIIHFFIDSYAGYFAIYIVIVGLDPIKSAFIATITSFTANLLQPFMGYFSDKLKGKIPLFIGMLLNSILISMIGLTINYIILFLLILFGKMGSSLFHPAGANIAGAAGITKKDRSFAIFSTIGIIGFALSQPIFSFFTAKFGTAMSYLLAIPTILVAFYYLFFSNMGIQGDKNKINFTSLKLVLLKRSLPILLLFFIMVFRQAFIVSVNFFLPKVYQEWGFSRTIYSITNAIFLLSGALGIFIAGHITHKIKPKMLLFYSQLVFLPFFAGFILFGKSGNLSMSLIFLSLFGLVINAGQASNIVMGHRVVPEMTSTISGILMGFAWATSSFGPTVTALLKGALRGFPGLISGIIILTILPLIGSILAYLLPKEVDG